MSCHVALATLLQLVLLEQVAEKNAHAIDFLGLVVALLKLVKVLDSGSVVLNDTIDKRQCIPDKGRLTRDEADNMEESADQLLDFVIVCTIIQELSLVLIAHGKEALDGLAGTLVELTRGYVK